MPEPDEILNIDLYTEDGVKVHPETKASLVVGLDTAIENKVTLKGIRINNEICDIDANKIASITVPEGATYSLVKAVEAEENYLATFYLAKNGEKVGDSINLAKDFLLKSAGMSTCIEANKPLDGLNVGDPYLYFIVNTKDAEDAGENGTYLYINAAKFITTYNSGLGIYVDNNNNININLNDANAVDTIVTRNSIKLVQSGAVYAAISNLSEVVTTHVNNTNIHVTPEEKQFWNNKQSSLTFDTVPAKDSLNPITSGGVKRALSNALFYEYVNPEDNEENS